MVRLIAALQTTEDRDRVFHGRLVHEHRHEAARQRRVAFDMLAIFVQRRRADTVQLAAGQRRLQEVRGIHRAFGFPGADQRVHLVDEQDHATFGLRHFGKHGLQPLLELAAEFSARNQGAHIEGEQAFAFQAFGHVAIDDAQREAFGNRRLADTGLTDQHGVVLGTARENLDRAADFLVAPDHRIKLAFARILRQVARVFLQRLITFLGILAVSRAALAQLRDRALKSLRRDARRLQRVRRRIAGEPGNCQQQALHRHERIARLLGAGFRLLEKFGARLFEPQTACPGAGNLRLFGEGRIDALHRQLRPPAARADQVHGQLVAVVKQRLEDMGRRQHLVSAGKGLRLGALDQAARTFCILFDIHGFASPVKGRLKGHVRPRSAAASLLRGIWEGCPPGASICPQMKRPAGEGGALASGRRVYT